MNDGQTARETSNLMRSGMTALNTVSHILLSGAVGPADAAYVLHGVKHCSKKFVELLLEFRPQNVGEIYRTQNMGRGDEKN